MSSEQVFRLVTRVLCLIAVAFLLSEVLLLPTELHGMLHHLSRMDAAPSPSSAAEEDYWVRYYAGLSAARVLGIALYAWAALRFFQGTEKLRRFLLVA